MKTLILVDIQNDFLPGGALAVNEGDQILSIVNELIPHYEHVIATQDFHPANHGSFADNHTEHEIGKIIDLHGLEQVLWPVHCVEGTPGTEFASGLNTDGIDHIFQKGTDPKIDSYSGFHDNGHREATGLAEYLHKVGCNEVHIVGLATDYCVKFTALDALTEGFKTTLITDACRGVNLNPSDVENAIDEMQQAGATITTSDEILSDTNKTNPMKYKKKDIVIEAYEHQSNQAQKWPVNAPGWFLAAIKNGNVSQIPGGKLIIKTLEGDHTALDGDFIIQGVRGELYPCRSDIFAETYARVE